MRKDYPQSPIGFPVLLSSPATAKRQNEMAEACRSQREKSNNNFPIFEDKNAHLKNTIDSSTKRTTRIKQCSHRGASRVRTQYEEISGTVVFLVRFWVKGTEVTPCTKGAKQSILLREVNLTKQVEDLSHWKPQDTVNSKREGYALSRTDRRLFLLGLDKWTVGNWSHCQKQYTFAMQSLRGHKEHAKKKTLQLPRNFSGIMKVVQWTCDDKKQNK